MVVLIAVKSCDRRVSHGDAILRKVRAKESLSPTCSSISYSRFHHWHIKVPILVGIENGFRKHFLD